jgi:hypothetical protein
MGFLDKYYNYQIKMQNKTNFNDYYYITQPIQALNCFTNEKLVLEYGSIVYIYRDVSMKYDESRRRPYYLSKGVYVDDGVYYEPNTVSIERYNGLLIVKKAILCHDGLQDCGDYFYVNEEEFNQYSMNAFQNYKTSKDYFFFEDITDTNYYFTLYKSLLKKETKIFEFNEGLWCKYKEEAFQGILLPVVDIFTNYDKEIINHFSKGILDTLNDFNKILEDDKASKKIEYEMFYSTKAFLKDIHETISGFGSTKKAFLAIEDVIKGNLEEQEALKAKQENEAQMQRELIFQQEEQYRGFIQKVKYRRELLEDFNKPLIVDKSLIE